MNPRLAFCIQAAYAAGRSTLSLFGVPLDVRTKKDSSPVTDADEGAEKLLRTLIEKQYPGETVLGEEQGLQGAGDDRWLIDPIDGTKSFVLGVPLYATLLSYEVAGEPIVAACYVPPLDQMYYAEKGGGAFLNGRPIKASRQDQISQAVLLSGSFKSLEDQGRLAGYQHLARTAKMARGWSDAYGHMVVARGNADIMIDPILAHWDVSAPSLIVREAGGSFTDFQGQQALANEAISCAEPLLSQVLEAFRQS